MVCNNQRSAISSLTSHLLMTSQVGHGGGLLLPQLRTLRLAGNPLVLITDGCLAMATRLGELDLRNLTQLTAMEFGALGKMSSLRTLYLGTYHAAREFNIPRLLRHNLALRNLHVEVRWNYIEVFSSFKSNL